jgi:hypothetical protein
MLQRIPCLCLLLILADCDKEPPATSDAHDGREDERSSPHAHLTSDAGNELAMRDAGDASSAQDACGMASADEAVDPLPPNADCGGSSLRLLVRRPNGALPSAVHGTAIVDDSEFSFECTAEDGFLTGASFDPQTGGNHCQPCSILLWSDHSGHWMTESVEVHVENPETGSSVSVNRMDIEFTGPCGAATMNIVLD